MEIIKYLELNVNTNATCKTFWHTTKVVLEEKFIALNAYVTEKKKSQISDINFHLKKLENKANSTQK